MQKKGDIVINYMVLLILALVILVTVLIIFTGGFGFLFDKVRWAFRFIFELGPRGM